MFCVLHSVRSALFCRCVMEKGNRAVGIIVTVAVVMGIGAGFIMGSDLADTLTAWFQGQSGSVISMGLLIGAVVAAALYAVSLVMMLRVVSKYEVRV